MKDVLLKITGTITTLNGGKAADKDVIEFITEGQIQSRGRSTMIVYPEMEESGMEGAITRITISPSRVRVKRELAPEVETVMEFEKGKRYNGYYVTGYGPIPMEVLTNDIIMTDDDALGKKTLSIDYSMSLKGLTESRNQLDIKVLREIDKNE